MSTVMLKLVNVVWFMKNAAIEDQGGIHQGEERLQEEHRCSCASYDGIRSHVVLEKVIKIEAFKDSLKTLF